MSKIIIYDNKNILIADLDRTETRKDPIHIESALLQKPTTVFQTEHAAVFKEYKIIHSFSLKKQLKKIENIFKYHKEGGKNVKKSI